MTATSGLPPGTRVVWDGRARLWQGGEFVTGGAPWGLFRLAAAASEFARRLHAAGSTGLVPTGRRELAVADRLVERGVAHPMVAARPGAGRVVVVIPAYERADLLERCLRSLGGWPAVVVVDDGSRDEDGIRRAAVAHRARLIRHSINLGPAAARNTGLAATDAPIVAFLDSDCIATPGWLDRLAPHFDDPRVALVAPRVRPRSVGGSWLAAHEDARSALDMGDRRELVRPGGPLGFLPSAALLVRRSAMEGRGFEPALRVGEDVDLVWRLVDAGWHARYEPSVTVHHEPPSGAGAWARRRYEYGTSAADLERRHGGRLAPARLSGWNLAAGLLLVAGWRGPAALVLAAATGLLARRLRQLGAPPSLAVVVVGQGFVADAIAVGHALRREWWPLGWLALLAARRSRIGAAAALSMLAPIGLEYARLRPRRSLPGYGVLRLVEDAAYGSGVISSAARARRPHVLWPAIRWPLRRAPDVRSAS